MKDHQQSVKLREKATKPQLSHAQVGRKVAICFLATLIVSVMIVWLGFIGWGLIATLQWLLDHVRGF